MRPIVSITPDVTEDGAVILRFIGDSPTADLERRDRRHKPLGARRAGPVVGTLGVWFARTDPTDPRSEPARIHEVSLSLIDGLTPTEIKRFAWSRWLTAADAVARTGGDITHPSWRTVEFGDPKSVAGMLTRGLDAENEIPLPRRRPGRKGHPEEFYEKVANRYQELRERGIRSPTATIAREMHYSRSTVAGWIKKARRLGKLPPARRGRPG